MSKDDNNNYIKHSKKTYDDEEWTVGHTEIPNVYHNKSSSQQPITQKTSTTVTYSNSKKVLITVIVSSFCMISSLSHRAYFPALPLVARDFGVSISLVNLTITVYAIFQGISPSFWGPISDSWGRRPVYLVSFLIFIVTCLGLASIQAFWGLLILRMLQAYGESSSIALGFGTIGDITVPAERASYSHVLGSTLTISMATSPVLGGIVTYGLSWRWIFWILFITGVIVWIMIYLYLPETLRSIVDNKGSPTPPLNHRHFMDQLLFLRYPDFNLIMITNSCFTVITTLLMITTATHYSTIYHLNVFQVGLCFIPFATGCTLGSYLIGKLLNYHFKKTALTYGITKEEIKKLNEVPIDFPIYRARLNIISIVIIFGQSMVIIYGWTLSPKFHLAIPLFFQFLIGLSTGPVLNACHTLLIDLFPTRGASVVAAGNIVTSIFRALSTGTIEIAIIHVGIGWSFTITGILMTAGTIIVPILIKYGPIWRKSRKEEQQEQQHLLQTGSEA
ncbi:major facilitator superfamily domain-containing protein [Phascolomyces articulosus]|uniref:Major facilitator superfamily domain-containing protein n=1 Tax=Phascolomyces articulosus TaxID=60185 RepID=A0AAD5K247_9FUNG|nr:major facilitator superfamily domain-containing protein [Phascolomyces articulosus]